MQTDEDARRIGALHPDAGYLLLLRLHPRERIAWMEAGLEAARLLKHRSDEGIHLGNLGTAYDELGEPRRAIESYEQVLTIADELGDRHIESLTLLTMSHALYQCGQQDQALILMETALTIFEQIESPYAEQARQKLADWRNPASE